MNKSLLIFLVLLFFLSCEKTEKVTTCNTPVEELKWLNELKSSFTDCTCQVTIFQAVYHQQTVFYWLMNDPLCDGYQQIGLLDCSGTIIKTYDIGDESLANEVTERKTIYTCKTK